MGGKGVLKRSSAVKGSREWTEALGVRENTTWIKFVHQNVTFLLFCLSRKAFSPSKL